MVAPKFKMKAILHKEFGGLLHIFLEREIPEHQKPRKIEINSKIN